MTAKFNVIKSIVRVENFYQILNKNLELMIEIID